MEPGRLALFAATATIAAGSAWFGCVGDSATTSPPDAGATVDATGDVGNPGDAGDAGPGWTPTALGTRLAVWLDGTRGVAVSAGKVTSWKDQSGNNNDAVQANAENAPSVDPVDAGGHSALLFNVPDSGAKEIYLTIPDNPSSLHWGLSDYTVALVSRYSNAAGTYAALWTKSTDIAAACPCNGLAVFANSKVPPQTSLAAQVAGLDPDAGATTVISSVTGSNDGRFHVFVVRRTGKTSLEVRTDGVATMGTVVAMDESAPNAAVGIGAGATGFSGTVGKSQLLYGDIAEVVAAVGTVTDPELASMESYLKAKYGL